MRWIRWPFLIVCVLATCLIVWAGIYARKQGFTESWRNAIEAEFQKRGYHVNIGKLTLGAFRGLVAEDVRFFQDADRQEELAFLDDVHLDVDLSQILSKRVSVNSLDVEDASLWLPLDPAKPRQRQFRVSDLSGRVVITESMIEILEAEASVAGLNLQIKGSLLRAPGDAQGGEGAEEENDALVERRRQLRMLLRELGKYEFMEEAPVVSIQFRGDLDNLATTTAKATVEATRFRKKGQTYEVKELSARLRFDGLSNRAEIEELLIRDGQGELALTGAWSQENARFDFELESDANLTSLAQLVRRDRKFGEIVFFSPPEIEAEGHVDLGRLGEEEAGFPGKVLGEFRSERFVTRGAVFAGVDFGFSVAGRGFYVRNLRLDHETGVAFLNLKHEPGEGARTVQYQTEVKMDPLVFRPFLDEHGRKFLDSWDFGESSTVYLAAVGQGSAWNPETWSNRGVVDLRNFRLNGVPFQEMEADFESKGPQQWFRDVSMVREEGRILAEVAQHDVKSRQWEVKGVVSTVDPIEGARAFNPELAAVLEAYRYDQPPRIELAGALDARRQERVGDEQRRNELELSFSCEGAARYDFLGETLELSRPSGKISVNGSRVHLTSFEAGVLGGRLELEYDARDVRSPSGPFDASVSVSGVPLEEITRLYGDTDAARGTLDTVFNLSGRTGDVSSISGHGSASISEGHLFAIPVLGPLSRAIERANPGEEDAGHSIAREAGATLRIEDGVVRTDDIEALTESFRVRAVGSVSMVDQSIDIEAVVGPRGELTGALMTPVSELLTFSGTGTVTEPEWEAKHISNLGKLPARVIAEMTNAPVEGLKKIGQGLFGPRENRREIGGAEPGDREPGERLRGFFRLGEDRPAPENDSAE